MYGAQPTYMNVENDGKANMVFLRNSNAMGTATNFYILYSFWITVIYIVCIDMYNKHVVLCRYQ